MNAIIIKDTDARALLDKLKIRSMQSNNVLRENYDQPPTMVDMHQAFHYVVCRWLQEQGADVVGR